MLLTADGSGIVMLAIKTFTGVDVPCVSAITYKGSKAVRKIKYGGIWTNEKYAVREEKVTGIFNFNFGLYACFYRLFKTAFE